MLGDQRRTVALWQCRARVCGTHFGLAPYGRTGNQKPWQCSLCTGETWYKCKRNSQVGFYIQLFLKNFLQISLLSFFIMNILRHHCWGDHAPCSLDMENKILLAQKLLPWWTFNRSGRCWEGTSSTVFTHLWILWCTIMIVLEGYDQWWHECLVANSFLVGFKAYCTKRIYAWHRL